MLPQQSMLPEQYHGTTWVADKTIETINQRRGDTPFMIWSSFIEPHPPFDVPGEWAHLYDDVKIPDGYDSITPVSAIVEENKAIAEYHDETDKDRAKRLYYCAISFVDHHIGRILDALEEKGQIDNTLIVFTSDHGEMLGDMATYQKFLPYDGASKIPFIARYPKHIEKGSRD
jgi:arylsulfatase A-like enzyme